MLTVIKMLADILDLKNNKHVFLIEVLLQWLDKKYLLTKILQIN